MKTLTALHLYTLIILEGFISIGLEILAIRQVLPFVGSNIMVTSIIIGGFLLALATGYYSGGQVKYNFLQRLQKNLLLVQLIVILGLSAYFLFILNILITNNYWFLITFTGFVVFPATFLLGQTVPILSNYFNAETYGELSGKILFLSTIGSFFGSILTATFLMNFIGVSNTISILSSLMTLLIIILSQYTNRFQDIAVSIFLSLFSLIILNNVKIDFLPQPLLDKLAKAGFPFAYENSYSSVFTQEKNGIRYLSINRSNSSSFDPIKKESTFDYIQHISKKLSAMSGKSILVVGAGAFTLGYNDKNNHYTYIDIDEGLQQVSEEKILKDKINGRFLTADARSYFSGSLNEKYDIIINDVFQQGISLPAWLLTSNYIKQLINALNEDGQIYFNIIALPNFNDSFSRHVNNTITHHMNCLVEPIHGYSEFDDNIVYHCFPKPDNYIYQDDNINLIEMIR